VVHDAADRLEVILAAADPERALQGQPGEAVRVT
jgi:hypothetical protein